MKGTIFVIFVAHACAAERARGDHQLLTFREPGDKTLLRSDTGINFGPFRKLNVLGPKGVVVSDQSIDEFTSKVLRKRGGKYEDRSTYVVDLNRVVDQYNKFKAIAPNVEVHYAIKANSDPYLSYIMAQLGAGFDCSSRYEIEAVIEGLGVDPSRIIFANTAKSPESIQYAVDRGVTFTIFDDVSELEKLADSKGDFKLLIRLLAEVTKASIPFTDKFGAMMEEVPCLLGQARDKGLDVIGVHFHLGEGLSSTKPFDEYIKKAKKVFRMGKKLGFNMTVLDIGGGFVDYPNAAVVTLEETMATVNRSLAEAFKGQAVRLLAEPGRYFAAVPFDLYATIIKRRLPHHTETTKMVYYVTEPATGQLNNISYLPYDLVEPYFASDRGQPFLNCPPANQSAGDDEYESLIYGPSSEPADRYQRTPSLPLLNLGDRLRFPAKGAYSISSSSLFNGFQRPRVFYTIKPKYEHLLK
ncbi:Ornithine decarboxylase [Halotydeus destructor]|nr:Ornithine decarboxylase [Halotydeus destructor]